MGETDIEWTDVVWNMMRGCSRVSRGCGDGTGGGCYAERMAHRFSGEGMPYEGLTRMTPGGPRWTGKVRLVPELLEEPLRWRKPRRVFVNSMSDLFHEDVPAEFIAKVFAVIALAPRHTFQILTKRAERMARLLGDVAFWAAVNEETDMLLKDEDSPVGPGRGWNGLERRSDDARATAQDPTADEPLENAWFGVSVEDQAAADERIPHLLATPAAVRFLSCEPLLGPVSLQPTIDAWARAVATGSWAPGRIGWVIAGAESGPGARPMDEDWVRSLRDQCSAAGVPFFYKQRLDARGRKVSLPELDGRTWAEFPRSRSPSRTDKDNDAATEDTRD